MKDDKWAFAAPYLTLMTEDAPQREYPLREVFNGLRWIIRAGAPWRMMPNDLPPWHVVDDQTHRWLKAGVFESMVHDLRMLLRLAEGRHEQPSAAIQHSRTLQSSPESGSRAGYDGAKRKKGSKVHVTVDTLGYLLALRVLAGRLYLPDSALECALLHHPDLLFAQSIQLIYQSIDLSVGRVNLPLNQFAVGRGLRGGELLFQVEHLRDEGSQLRVT